MKNTKELLQLVLKELEEGELFTSGLCMLVVNMKGANVFTFKEEMQMYHYIHKYGAPKRFTKRASDQRGSAYYWPMGQKAPRIAWLKRRIKWYKFLNHIV
jgi:hypothetical protein